MKTKISLEQKNQQTLVLTQALQQALHVLQLPIVELAPWVQLQIEENPLLQFDETLDSNPSELDFEVQGFEVLDHLDDTFIQGAFPDFPENPPSAENLLQAPPSLYSHLMQQARAAFSSPADLVEAEQIIGNLDHQGFLGDSTANPTILAKVQEFDPPGIAAQNLQECLLIQLRAQSKENSLAYSLVAHHFDDLLHSRFASLTKKLSKDVKEIQEALRKDLSPLDFHPASKFQASPSLLIVPDIILDQSDAGYQIRINEEPLPSFTLAPSPTPHLNRYYTAGKWMEQILARRRDILTQITYALLEKHPDFFFETASPGPLPMHQIARELGLHTSTIARAVKDKYLACPRGIFPLKYFFPHAAAEEGKAVSHLTAKQLLQELITTEDKKRPFSDHALVRLMTEAGIPCARRTITKYRRSLHIPSSSQRKKV